MSRVGSSTSSEHTGGRLVVLQGGSHSEFSAPYCTMAIIETLPGVGTRLTEPFGQE